MELEFPPCPTCREITMVEAPPCVDPHDGGGPARARTRLARSVA